nr:MAG TPA: hypothetical protein [Caudoviricetes sp.]
MRRRMIGGQTVSNGIYIYTPMASYILVINGIIRGETTP